MDYFKYYYIDNIGTSGTFLTDIIFAVTIVLLFCKFEISAKGLLRFTLQVITAWFVCVFWASIYYVMLPDHNAGYIFTTLFAVACLIFVFKYERFVIRIIHGSIFVTLYAYLPALLLPIVMAENELIWNNYKIFGTLLRLIIVILAILFLKKLDLGRFREISIYFVVIMESICLIGYVLNIICVLIITIPMDSPITYNFFSCLSLLLIEFLAYWMFYKLHTEHNEKVHSQLENQRLESEALMFDIYNQNYEDIRMIRHDLKNQVSYVSALLKQGDKEKAIEYFDEIAGAAEQPLSYIYTENKTINILLNLKTRKAELAGVTIRNNVCVPQKLAVSDADLSSILTNLLDNAIEASEKVKHIMQPEITVDIAKKQNMLLISITNPTADGAESLKLMTTKKDKYIHGFGTKIISKLAQKYNGVVQYKSNGWEFLVDIMLSLHEGETDKDGEN